MDEQHVVDFIRPSLAVCGFDTAVATNGQLALRLIETVEPDILLLDLMAPDADWPELCRRMRERSGVGIIVVSAARGERDKISALYMGADYYITKPFSAQEILAHITAILRRTFPGFASEQPRPVIRLGDVQIDLARQRVCRRGYPVNLTRTEFALLRELAVNRGRVLTHRHLLRRVWGLEYETQTEYLHVYVRRLRSKLETEGSPPLILTRPWTGYWLVREIERQ
jgi:two-component system KDP operon response regulator KdpE